MTARPATPTIAAFATKGSGSNDERRIRALLRDHAPRVLPFDRRAKLRSGWHVFRSVARQRPELLVMEGTGLCGGVACIAARLLLGCRYVVSSGDAVSPFVGGIAPALRPAFALYERLLYRLAAGFVGWTPYLVGRALTFGVPRAMFAAGWSDRAPAADARERIRAALGIPPDAIVFGIAGSIVWNRRYRYCYGMELVRAMWRIQRPDVYALIVGDGTGLPHLRAAAGDRLDRSILLPGAVPAERIADYLAAMDVGSLPQSVDRVGSFRYTTKLSEYLAARLPMVTGQIPLAYDLDDGWLWRLPGDAPWSDAYHAALARLMGELTPDAIAHVRANLPATPATFDPARQIRAANAFIADLLARPQRLAAGAA